MQEVISWLARVIVAHQECEWRPDRIENRLDVPENIDEQEAQRNPAQHILIHLRNVHPSLTQAGLQQSKKMP